MGPCPIFDVGRILHMRRYLCPERLDIGHDRRPQAARVHRRQLLHVVLDDEGSAPQEPTQGPTYKLWVTKRLAQLCATFDPDSHVRHLCHTLNKWHQHIESHVGAPSQLPLAYVLDPRHRRRIDGRAEALVCA